MIKPKRENKFFKYLFFQILILIFLNSCDQKNLKSDVYFKKKFYKILSKDNQLLSYNYRVYSFDKDTLKEICTTISLDGKLKGNLTNQFLIKGSEIYILHKTDNKINKILYFSTKKIDSCYSINYEFEKFKICYKGLHDNVKNNKTYRILFEEIDYDGSTENLILDNDFTLVSRFSASGSQKKEIFVNSNNVPQIVKNTANTLNL